MHAFYRAAPGCPRRVRRLTVVVHGLDVVPVGVENVGAVVAGVISRTLSRRAVVTVAGGERATVELARRRGVRNRKGEVDVLALASATVVDGLGAVAVRVEEEGAVVVVVVLGPWARLAVARVARLCSGVPERVHLLARARAERHVQATRHRAVFARLRDPEVVPLVEISARMRDRVAERLEDGLVEAPARLPVGDADPPVGEHARVFAAPPPPTGRCL